MCKLVVSVDHKPEYFNRIAMATIPESWTAEVIEGLPKHLKSNDHNHFRLYAEGETKQVAIDNLIIQLKRFNLSGKMKII